MIFTFAVLSPPSPTGRRLWGGRDQGAGWRVSPQAGPPPQRPSPRARRRRPPVRPPRRRRGDQRHLPLLPARKLHVGDALSLHPPRRHRQRCGTGGCHVGTVTMYIIYCYCTSCYVLYSWRRKHDCILESGNAIFVFWITGFFLISSEK